jgi:N-acetylmuramic acid 6-phosphate etherase
MSSLRRQRVSGGPGAAPVIGPERKFDRLHHTLANGLFSTSFNAGEPAMGRARLQWQNQEGQTRGPRRAGAALMETERPSPRYSAIELWNPADILETMIEGQFAAVAAVHAARPELERAALAIEARLKEGGRLVYAGAGTSGRLAVQDGAELMPTFGWPPERLLLLMAGGRDALLRAVEGAEDEVEQGARVVRQHKVDRKDVLIAVAASGTTPFTLACLCEAKACGALTVGIANNPNTPILNEADYPVYLDTGAEPIAGSTRMKAGTAQRVALTMLSSLRSEAILAQLTGHTREHVRDALARAQGNVKLALLLLEGSDIEVARTTLDRARGDLRAAKTLIEARRSQQRRA